MTGAAGSRSTRVRCARAWEVEGARDGRLAGAALGSFHRHLGHCADCRAELEALDRLQRDLRALGPVDVDDVAMQRVRRRTLATADALRLDRPGAPRRPAAAPWLAAAAALAAVVVGTVWSWQSAGHQAAALTPAPITQAAGTSASTSIEVADEGSALFGTRSDVSIEHVDLRDGALRFAVHRPASGKRLLVHVPDGEIEDIGTVFHVVVAAGHTQQVVVDEGLVSLRLEGTAAVMVAAGQTWRRDDQAQVGANTQQAEPPASASASASADNAAVPPARTPSLPRHALGPTPTTSAHDPTSDALGMGKEEDATYLRILQLVRRGETTEAQGLARDYLRRFPNGFRREEVKAIAR